MSNILIVEDEKKIAELLRDYLKQAGFDIHILTRGDKVIPLIKNNSFDLILLDLMLPGMNGIEVCRDIRKFSQIPIIMITAQTEEIDRLLGLELGADDYISKPFSPREVVARVKAVLRRVVQSSAAGNEIKAIGIRLNAETHQIWINEQEGSFTPVEFGLLKVFISNPQRVFSREELLNKVQGYDFVGYDRTIDTHVKNLRKKLSKHGIDNAIFSVYGVGYRLQSLVE